MRRRSGRTQARRGARTQWDLERKRRVKNMGGKLTENNYDLWNGLANANRDVVIKPFRIVEDKAKVKNVIGIGVIFYIWTKRPIFRWIQNPQPLPSSLWRVFPCGTGHGMCIGVCGLRTKRKEREYFMLQE